MKRTTTTTTKVTRRPNKNTLTRKIGRRIKVKRRRVRRTRLINKIPAAYAKKFMKSFRVIRQDASTMVVSGKDLIYKIPNDMISTNPASGVNVLTVIPCNPAYWIGTRIAALAQGYQNYRPLRISFHYVPMCAVTQQGNVLAGTLWNEAPSIDALQQSLRTSNGAMQTQCYNPQTSTVKMGRNLQFNLYRMGGSFDQQSNPFIFLALGLGCKNVEQQDIIPGYFYVSYTFSFHNPIGQSISYYNSGLIEYVDADLTPINKTAVILSESVAPFGSIVQLEANTEGDTEAFYNGTPITIAPTTTIWQFSNTTIKASNEQASVDGYKRGKTITIKTNSLYEAAASVPVFAKLEFDPDTDTFITTVYNQLTTTTIKAGECVITQAPLIYQNFGILKSNNSLLSVYTYPNKYVKLEVLDDQIKLQNKIKDQQAKLHMPTHLKFSGNDYNRKVTTTIKDHTPHRSKSPET